MLAHELNDELCLILSVFDWDNFHPNNISKLVILTQNLQGLLIFNDSGNTHAQIQAAVNDVKPVVLDKSQDFLPDQNVSADISIDVNVVLTLLWVWHNFVEHSHSFENLIPSLLI